MKKLIIFNYHNIILDDSEEDLSKFTIRFSRFIEHLNIINESKIPVIRLANWNSRNYEFENLSIALTFDDGFENHYKLVYPELNKRKIPATFFPIVSKIGQENHLKWVHLKEILESKFEIGSHGHSHKRLLGLSNIEMENEILHSKLILQAELKNSIRYFSIPYGVYSSKSINKIYSKYECVFTTCSKLNNSTSSIILHRFNIKSSWSLNKFLNLLKLNPIELNIQNISSKGAFLYNHFTGMINSIN